MPAEMICDFHVKGINILCPFVNYFELGHGIVSEESEIFEEAETGLDDELKKKLEMPVSELDLSVRAGNCLEMAKIETLGHLSAMTESELLALRSFGKTSLREVKRKLADLGITLGSEN